MEDNQLIQQLELADLDPRQRAWLAGRCALRALPVLANRGAEFPYWNKADVPRHVFAVFLALNAAWGRCFVPVEKNSAAIHSIRAAAEDAARAADAAGDDAGVVAAHAARAAVSAADATYDDDGAFGFAAANAVIAAARAVADVDAAYVDAADVDIRWLQNNLGFLLRWPEDVWQGQADVAWLDKWRGWCDTLEQGLRGLGLGYWADEFHHWLQGRFDPQRIERALSMPKEVSEQGVDAMLDWLAGRTPWLASEGEGDIARWENDLRRQAARIAELEQKNQHLQKELHQAGLSEEDKRRLEQEKTALEEQLEQRRQQQQDTEQALQAARDMLAQQQQEALSGRIEQSIEAISGSLVSADCQIQSHRRWSSRFRRAALALLGLALAAILWTLVSAPDAAALGKDGSMAFYLLRISPILLLLLMAATLLRHDAKLMQELRELIRQKQQVERLTGLYKASQYARREVEESRKLAEETFGKITDHLLALQDGKSEEAKPADKDGDDSMPAILKALTELIAGIKGKSTS